MAIFKTFDIAEIAVNEATNKFFPDFDENEGKKDYLRACCEAIDLLTAECGGSSLSVNVNEETQSIDIQIECQDTILGKMEDGLYDLVDDVESVWFSRIDDMTVAVCFIFPGIWDTTCG